MLIDWFYFIPFQLKLLLWSWTNFDNLEKADSPGWSSSNLLVPSYIFMLFKVHILSFWTISMDFSAAFSCDCNFSTILSIQNKANFELVLWPGQDLYWLLSGSRLWNTSKSWRWICSLIVSIPVIFVIYFVFCVSVAMVWDINFHPWSSFHNYFSLCLNFLGIPS